VPSFHIIEEAASNGLLVYTVDHFNPDGSFWHRENYVWRGSKGLTRKILRDADGLALMDDGKIAPVKLDVYGRKVQYLPAGRAWARQSQPSFSNREVLSAIRATHQRRLKEGWPQGRIDRLGKLQSSAADIAGVDQLKAQVSLLGYSE